MNIAAQLLVLTDKIMNYRGNTALFLPLPRGYRKFFYHPHGITVKFSPFTAVTVELPLSPLPCHCLVYT